MGDNLGMMPTDPVSKGSPAASEDDELSILLNMPVSLIQFDLVPLLLFDDPEARERCRNWFRAKPGTNSRSFCLNSFILFYRQIVIVVERA